MTDDTRRIFDARGNRTALPFALPKWLAAAMVAIAFLISQASWISSSLPLMGGDSGGYLARASLINEGALFQGNVSVWMYAYFNYNLLLAIFERLGVPLVGVVVLQTIVSALATASVYFLGRRLGGDRIAFLAALFFAIDPKISRWNGFVLTDSLYVSLVPIVVLMLWRVFESPSLRRSVPAMISLLAIVPLRPQGWLWPILVGIGFLMSRGRAKLLNFFAFTAISAVILFFMMTQIDFFRSYLNEQKPGKLITNGEVVWSSDAYRIDMPIDPDSKGHDDVATALNYVSRHPLAVAKLMIARIAVEVMKVRPFYSPKHNLAILAFFLPLHAMALIGCFAKRNDPLARWMMTAIAGHLGITAIMQANWDGRWLDHVLSLIGVLAAAGCVSVIDAVRNVFRPRTQTTGA